MNIKILNNITLLDSMGSDLTVVNAARVSLSKSHEVFEEENDTRLINYLAKHKHKAPFFHPKIQFRIRMPIFIARQWFKHNIGIDRSEESRRYIDNDPEFYEITKWREASSDIKQGSLSSSVDLTLIQDTLSDHYLQARELYGRLLDLGACAEQARTMLPQSMYTEWIETGSLYAYANLVELRTSEHAQKEIKDYALVIERHVSKLFPVSWQALMETMRDDV